MTRYCSYYIDENRCFSPYRLHEFSEDEASLIEPLLKHVNSSVSVDQLPDKIQSKVMAACTGEQPAEFLKKANPLYRADFLDHNGRELTLMLRGVKPLAVFSTEPDRPLSDATDQGFDPHVDAGRIGHKRVRIVTESQHGDFDLLFYFLPGEEWRARAYELVYRYGNEFGFRLNMDAMFSELLGYSQDEIRHYLEIMKDMEP